MAGGTRLPGPRAVLGSAVQAQAAGRSRIGAVAADCSRLAPTAPAHCRVRSRGGARARPHPLGWQPSRFLTDRAEAERAYALAERLGSVNAAASQLGTTWPSLRKAFTRHGLGMPTRNPEAVRQRAVAAARQRSGQPATPPLDPVFVALNPNALPARPRPPAELHQWVRRDEEYAILGANVVVELNSESRARQPTTRAWAIIRRAERAHRDISDRQGRGQRRQADRATRSDRASRSDQPEERGMVADAR
jgi:hypothetical protein